MFELPRRGHPGIDLVTALVAGRHPFEALRRHALTKALHRPVEQGIFDAALPCASQQSIAFGCQLALQVVRSDPPSLVARRIIPRRFIAALETRQTLPHNTGSRPQEVGGPRRRNVTLA